MTQKKKLLTYNTEKSPLVDEFFTGIESGMQSHYMREAIEFYMKYKTKIYADMDRKIGATSSVKESNDMNDKYLESILWYLSNS